MREWSMRESMGECNGRMHLGECNDICFSWVEMKMVLNGLERKRERERHVCLERYKENMRVGWE